MRFFFCGILKELCVYLAIFSFVCCVDARGTSNIGQPDQLLNWDRIMEAYSVYVDLPTPDNAKCFLNLLPEDRPDQGLGDPRKALKYIFSADNIPVLYEEAISGENRAVEILFRLLFISDGYYKETVESTLGWLARDMPGLFLEILARYKDTKPMKEFGYPVSFIGTGHNVHPKAARYVLEKRLIALDSVKDPKYEKIKSDCIKQLREAINGRVNR